MLDVAHLLALADTYQAANAVRDTTLSFRIFRDSKKLSALRGDADITTQRFNGALRWFSENWPEGVEWPAAIARPAPTGEAAA